MGHLGRVPEALGRQHFERQEALLWSPESKCDLWWPLGTLGRVPKALGRQHFERLRALLLSPESSSWLQRSRLCL